MISLETQLDYYNTVKKVFLISVYESSHFALYARMLAIKKMNSHAWQLNSNRGQLNATNLPYN